MDIRHNEKRAFSLSDHVTRQDMVRRDTGQHVKSVVDVPLSAALANYFDHIGHAGTLRFPFGPPHAILDVASAQRALFMQSERVAHRFQYIVRYKLP